MIYLQEQKSHHHNQPMLGGVRSVGGGLHIGKKKVKRKTHQTEKQPLLLPPIPGVGKKTSPVARMVDTKQTYGPQPDLRIMSKSQSI